MSRKSAAIVRLPCGWVWFVGAGRRVLYSPANQLPTPGHAVHHWPADTLILKFAGAEAPAPLRLSALAQLPGDHSQRNIQAFQLEVGPQQGAGPVIPRLTRNVLDLDLRPGERSLRLDVIRL